MFEKIHKRSVLVLICVSIFIGSVCANLDVIAPEHVRIVERELNPKPSDTSAAEQILDYLVENNSAVNFALKRGNNNGGGKGKRKPSNNDKLKDGKLGSLDDQINDRIKDLLNKKQEKLKNATVIDLNLNSTFETIDTLTNIPSTRTTMDDSKAVQVPEFFSNAYNRVVNLLASNKTQDEMGMPMPPKKPTEEEILMAASDANTLAPLALEDTINEIGSQLILGGGLVSTPNDEIKIEEQPDVSITTTDIPDTTTFPIPSTTASTTTLKTTQIPRKATTTIKKNPVQMLGDRVGTIIDRLGLSNKAKTDKPALSKGTYSYEIPPSTTPQGPNIDKSMENRDNKEKVEESVHNVQNFLSQFGVSVSNYATTTPKGLKEETDEGSENAAEGNF